MNLTFLAVSKLSSLWEQYFSTQARVAVGGKQHTDGTSLTLHARCCVVYRGDEQKLDSPGDICWVNLLIKL